MDGDLECGHLDLVDRVHCIKSGFSPKVRLTGNNIVLRIVNPMVIYIICDADERSSDNQPIHVLYLKVRI